MEREYFEDNEVAEVLNKCREIIIAGDIENHSTIAMLNEINNRFLPNTVVILNNSNEALDSLIPSLKLKRKVNNQTTAYICENFSCSPPITDIETFKSKLDKASNIIKEI